ARPRSAFRTMPPPDRRRPLWVLLGVLALAVAVSVLLWYLRVRPDPADLRRGAGAGSRPGQERRPRPGDARAHAPPPGRPPAEPRPVAELVASAQADLARDTEASDLAAERTLETALVQDPPGVGALGLGVE